MKILLPNNKTEMYDPNQNKWTTLANFPLSSGLSHFGIALENDNVWLVGGRLNATRDVTNQVWRYNITNNTWQRGPDLPYNLASGALVKLGRKLLFLAGGTHSPSDIRKLCVLTNYFLTLDLDNPNSGWKSGEYLPLPSHIQSIHSSVAVIGGKIYLVGGQYGHDCGEEDHSKVFRFDPSLNEWERLADMPFVNSHNEGASFAVDGKFISAGGQIVGDKVMEYNTWTNSWRQLDLIRNGTGNIIRLIGPISKVIGNKIFIATGGLNSSNYQATKLLLVKNFNRVLSDTLAFSTKKIELNLKNTDSNYNKNVWLWTYQGKANYQVNLSNLPDWLSITKDPGNVADETAVEFKIQIKPQFLQQGTNSFSLMATAPNYTNAKLDIIINTNLPPTVNAGSDRAIILPQNFINISGTAQDADGQIVTRLWTQRSGPNIATLINSNTENLRAENLLQGNYIFRLTATDNLGATAFDEMKVSVLGSGAPIVNAGADKVISLPLNQTNLSGSANDVDGNISTYQWSQTTGPNTANIQNANNSQATVSNLIAGNYTFRLTAWDNDNLSDFDEVNVLVNQTPIVNAGLDQNFKSPPQDSTQLIGIASDNDGTINQIQWTQINGPNTALIVNANALSTKVKNLIVGIYTFRLQVTDNQGAVSSDDVLITVELGQQTIAAFFLVDADNDVIIRKMKDNETINMSTLNAQGIQNINIRVNTQPSKVGSVRLILSGKESRVITENGSPYTLFGDTNGNYGPWNPSTGSYTLTATPYTLTSAGGVAGLPLVINFSVTRNNNLQVKPTNSNIEVKNKLLIYPNPFDNELIIKDLDKYTGKLNIQISDLNGQVLYDKSYLSTPQNLKLELKTLPTGVYLLIIKGQNHADTFLIEKR
jgi:N-acetylneuraminic acid mutarotase